MKCTKCKDTPRVGIINKTWLCDSCYWTEHYKVKSEWKQKA